MSARKASLNKEWNTVVNMPQPRKLRGNSEVARKTMRSKDMKKSSPETKEKKRMNSQLGDLAGGRVNYYGGIDPAYNYLRDGKAQSRTEKRYVDQTKRKKAAAKKAAAKPVNKVKKRMR